MQIIKEFRAFAARGSMVDMAVGIIIGGAFGTIVRSLVDDVLMPPLGFLTGGVDFAALYIALDGRHYENLDAAKAANAPVIGYGAFINNVISFFIMAFAVFLLVRTMNRLKRQAEEEPAKAPEPSAEVVLLTQIRDSLARAD